MSLVNYPTIRPSLILDFQKAEVVDPRITFTRATTATRFNSYGVLESVAANVPRIDFDPSTLVSRGLLIEEQRTNSIRNNTMQGAVAGSPGTLPTNWAWSATTAGLTVEVIGTGVESGITYIDLKMSGTADGTSFTLGFEPSSIVTASSGQTWTLSTYSRIVGGSLSNIVYNLSITEQNGGSVLTSGAVAVTPTTDPLNSQRFSFTRTLVNASTNNIRPRPRFDTTAGAVDLTLRIGLPQLELGAFATSVIPTTTTALTRNADVASMTGTNFSSWYNQTEGTIFYVYGDTVPNSAGTLRRIFAASDGTSNNLVLAGFGGGGGVANANITTAGASQTSGSFTATMPLTNTKATFAFKANDVAFAFNGNAPVVDNTATIPSTISQVFIGSHETGGTNSAWYLNGHIQRIAYYPTRLPNATLVALTA